MIYKHFYIFLVLLGFWSYNAYSQENCTVPLSPVLTSVSVEPETGKTDFRWTLSPSSDIAAYIVYTYKNGDGMPIDTIWDPTATSYSYQTNATKYLSVSYVVTAHRLSVIPGLPGCTSPLSNVISTIFCAAQLDTCNKKILISWNKYSDFPKHVTGYKIIVSENDGPLSAIDSVSSDKDSYTFADFTANSQYCILIKATLEDGTESNSNKNCLSTKMQRPPEWINADYATVNPDNSIALSFTIDPLSEIKLFSLQKRTGQSGVFQEIAQPVSVNGVVSYSDNKADLTSINYYMLTAINSCNIPVTASNIASNIVLSLKAAENDLILSWNSYKKWLGSVSSYRLFINTGNGFGERAIIQPSDTVYKLSYKEIMYEVSGNQVCFYVDASEISNPFGITGQSQSSSVCSVALEIITVPNLFTPNSDLLNDFFRPVLSFTPLDYHLIINDIKGNVLFDTRDYLAEWDGTLNGKPQSQGVYLWFLKVTTPSGKNITKTGTITIVRDK